MDILFSSTKLAKTCNSQTEREKKFGTRRGVLIGRRLDELRAAASLAEIARVPPPRCHELTGDRKGQLSVDLDHPYRLIFTVANDPVPKKEDGGLDWAQVTAVEIVGVEDTHG